MGKWISIKERLPKLSAPVWVLFCKKNGEPRKQYAVRDADYIQAEQGVYFTLAPHRNWYISAEGASKYGLAYWQPRVGATPPPPELEFSPRRVEPTIGEEHRCGGCGQIKGVEHFHRHGRAGQMRTKCKLCVCADQKAYYKRSRDRLLAKAQQRYASDTAFREKRKATTREWMRKKKQQEQ